MTPQQEASFATFVTDEGDALLRYARLVFEDAHEAEDALQVALVRLCKHWPRALDHPSAYVRTALRNLAVDSSRRRHLVAVPVDSSCRPDAQPLPDHADRLAGDDRLRALLARLPHRQRLTVVLRVLDGLDEREAAGLLGCSTGTVKSNLSRGLARLRELLAEDVADEGAHR